jgi:histone deacetylase complex regulatory component SIN3
MDEAADAFRGLQIQDGKKKRELKLEDALSYLDQVKLVFGERTEIYNELLETMEVQV